MRRASLTRWWLLALLIVVPIGLRGLESDVHYLVRFAARGTAFSDADRWIFALENIIAILSYLLAGLAFDAIGLKRTIGIVILIWAAVVAFGATFGDPVSYIVLSQAFTVMLPGFVVTGVLLATRLAWPLRRRGVVIAVLLAAYGYAVKHGVSFVHFPLSREPHAVTWQYPVLALTTVGTVLFAGWICGLREIDASSGLDLRPVSASSDVWTDIVFDPRVWLILGMEVCLGIVWSQSLKVRWEFGTLGGDVAFSSPWLIPVAAIAAAWASDRVYRKHRDGSSARRPFVIAGFALAGIAPLFATLASQNSPALQIIDLAAIGVARVADLLVVDCAPRRFAGRYIGVVLAGETGVLTYLRPGVEALASAGIGSSAIIFVFAIAGAVLAIVPLSRMRTAEP